MVTVTTAAFGVGQSTHPNRNNRHSASGSWGDVEEEEEERMKEGRWWIGGKAARDFPGAGRVGSQ